MQVEPRTIMGIGGVALAASPFLAWVKVVLLRSLSLFQILRVTGEVRCGGGQRLVRVDLQHGSRGATKAWRTFPKLAH
jgi:hypothetical protein